MIIFERHWPFIFNLRLSNYANIALTDSFWIRLPNLSCLGVTYNPPIIPTPILRAHRFDTLDLVATVAIFMALFPQPQQ